MKECTDCEPPRWITRANFLRHTKERHLGLPRGGRRRVQAADGEDEEWCITPAEEVRYLEEDAACSESVLPEFNKFCLSIPGGKKNEKEAAACVLQADRFLKFSRRHSGVARAEELRCMPYSMLDILSCDLNVYSAWVDPTKNRLMRSLLASSRVASLQRIKKWIHFRRCCVRAGDPHRGTLAALYSAVDTHINVLVKVLSKEAAMSRAARFSVDALNRKQEWCSLEELKSCVLDAEEGYRCLIAQAAKGGEAGQLTVGERTACLQLCTAAPGGQVSMRTLHWRTGLQNRCCAAPPSCHCPCPVFPLLSPPPPPPPL
jgi:hypothetical protein